MKATGEVMAIDRCFEGALLKAVRSLEIGVDYLSLKNWNRSHLSKSLNSCSNKMMNGSLSLPRPCALALVLKNSLYYRLRYVVPHENQEYY